MVTAWNKPVSAYSLARMLFLNSASFLKDVSMTAINIGLMVGKNHLHFGRKTKSRRHPVFRAILE